MPYLQGFNTTETLGYTQPPTTAPKSDNPIIEILIYLFAAICIQNPICSGIFRIIFSLILEAISIGIAFIPVARIVPYGESGRAQRQRAGGFMLTAWIASNIAGGFAAKATYESEIPYPVPGNDIEKYEAVTDAMFSHTLVTNVYTGVAAGLYVFTPDAVTYMRNKFKEKCCSPANRSTDYFSLSDENQPRCCL